MRRLKSDLPDLRNHLDEILDACRHGDSWEKISKRHGVSPSHMAKFFASTDELREAKRIAVEDSAESWISKGLKAVEDSMGEGMTHAQVTAARNYAQECARMAAIRNRAYSEKSRVEHEGPKGGPIKIDIEFCKTGKRRGTKDPG